MDTSAGLPVALQIFWVTLSTLLRNLNGGVLIVLNSVVALWGPRLIYAVLVRTSTRAKNKTNPKLPLTNGLTEKK